MFRLAALCGLVAFALAVRLTRKIRREGPAVGSLGYSAVANGDTTSQVRGYGSG